jgi:hypothetical protein
MGSDPIAAFAEWLSGTAPSVAIQSTVWFIRLLQATHLLTAGVVVASGVLISLRVLGWHRADLPVDAVWRRFAPWLGWGLAVMIITGILQVLGDPVRAFTATSWWAKMGLLLLAAGGTRWLAHVPPSRAALRRAGPPSRGALRRAGLAAALILCWLAIPLLGRTIAYDRTLWGDLSLRR